MRRHEWRLERAGGDHHLARLIGTVIELHDVTVGPPPHRADAALQFDRKIELARIVDEVIRHLVPRRITIRLPGKLHAWQRVVARGCEELQGVPALAPCRRRLFRGLEDREVCALLREVVADREAGLAAADHDYIAVAGDGAGHDVLIREKAAAGSARGH